MDLGISGRMAAVAAASSGLGLAAAAALAAEGAKVVICGRDRDRIEAAAKEINAIALVCDVSTLAGGVAFVRQAIEALGGQLDILVTNSGGPARGGFRDVTPEQYEEALQNNLMSMIGMCHTAVEPMRTRGWGRIVAITSVTVRQPMPELILSTTARAGLTGFLKTLAGDVAPYGVTVNSVLPGRHDTSRAAAVYGAGTPTEIPVGRAGDPADFGQVVTFLASAQARQITGQSLLIDGGQYLGLL